MCLRLINVNFEPNVNVETNVKSYTNLYKFHMFRKLTCYYSKSNVSNKFQNLLFGIRFLKNRTKLHQLFKSNSFAYPLKNKIVRVCSCVLFDVIN